MRWPASPTGRRLQKKDLLAVHERLRDFELRRQDDQIRVGAGFEFTLRHKPESLRRRGFGRPVAAARSRANVRGRRADLSSVAVALWATRASASKAQAHASHREAATARAKTSRYPGTRSGARAG